MGNLGGFVDGLCACFCFVLFVNLASFVFFCYWLGPHGHKDCWGRFLLLSVGKNRDSNMEGVWHERTRNRPPLSLCLWNGIWEEWMSIVAPAFLLFMSFFFIWPAVPDRFGYFLLRYLFFCLIHRDGYRLVLESRWTHADAWDVRVCGWRQIRNKEKKWSRTFEWSHWSKTWTDWLLPGSSGSTIRGQAGGLLSVTAPSLCYAEISRSLLFLFRSLVAEVNFRAC